MPEQLREPVLDAPSDSDREVERDDPREGLARLRAGEVLARVWTQPVSAVIGAFVLVVIAFSLLNPELFPTVGNARNIALDASVTLILAVGVAFVVVSGHLDLSIGSVNHPGFRALPVMCDWPVGRHGLMHSSRFRARLVVSCRDDA